MNAETHVTRLILLPGALMGFGTIGLGITMWVIRRR